MVLGVERLNLYTFEDARRVVEFMISLKVATTALVPSYIAAVTLPESVPLLNKPTVQLVICFPIRDEEGPNKTLYLPPVWRAVPAFPGIGRLYIISRIFCRIL